jgi:hypothetical protein
VATVADRARCYLAQQHQRVLESILDLWPEALHDHVSGRAAPADQVLVAAVVDIDGGVAQLDDQHLLKQPDWTYNDIYSGQSPADRIDQRSSTPL